MRFVAADKLIIAGLALVTTGVVWKAFTHQPSVRQLAGEWNATVYLDHADLAKYRGLTLTFRIFLTQDGEHLMGSGEKWKENGTPLPASARTPIELNGIWTGDKVTLNYTERGARRTSVGQFSLEADGRQETLHGTLSSTASNARGRTIWHKRHR